MLVEGVDVGEHLAGMVLVGEPVDHRHARLRGEALDDRLLEGADHDDVDHARDDARAVLDGLAAAQLRLARVEHDRRASQLVDAGFERHARARRALLEDHCQHAVGERLVGDVVLEPLLDQACAAEKVFELPALEVGEPQEMLHAAAAAAASARNVFTSGTRMATSCFASSSRITSGGSRRTTVSAGTLITIPASRPRRTRSPHGRSSSTPSLSPRARVSLTPATPANPRSRPVPITPPPRRACSSRPSFSIPSTAVRPATDTRGPPPTA